MRHLLFVAATASADSLWSQLMQRLCYEVSSLSLFPMTSRSSRFTSLSLTMFSATFAFISESFVSPVVLVFHSSCCESLFPNLFAVRKFGDFGVIWGHFGFSLQI